MTVESGAQYLDLLEKSRLLDDATLQGIRQQYADVEDPRALARNLVDNGILTEWQSRFLLSGRHRLMIGQYQLLERFSRQNLGDRFLGRHRQLDRQVDVYLFPPNTDANKEEFSKFLEEAARVAGLDHPHLMHLYDIDQESGRYYLVFEHDDGDSLRNTPQGSFNARQIAGIMEQSLDAIGYAHRNDILHGKLDATQIRVDTKGKVCLRNIGLANLLDRLHQANREQDEFGVPPQAIDDVVALGKVGRSLLQRHVGAALTDSDKALAKMMDDLSSCHADASVTLDASHRALQDWIQNHDAAQAKSQPATSPIATHAAATGAATAAKATGGKVKPAAAAATRQPNKTPLIAAMAVAGLLVLVGGGYLLVNVLGGGDAGQQAKTGDSSGQKQQAINQSQTESGNGGSSIDTAAKRFDSSGQDDAADPAPQPADDSKTGSDASQTTGEIARPVETSAETPAKTDATPETDVVAQAPQDEANARETTMPAAAGNVVFPGAGGLPLVDWGDAESHVGDEAVVFGKIRSVGDSGPFRFLNFTARRSNSFTIVIDSRKYEISAGELRKLYDEKNVLVRGKIELYERNQTPQIEVTGPHQLRIIDELPEPGQLVAGGSSTLGGTDTTPGTSSSPGGTGAFDLLGKSLAIPSLDRNDPDFGKTPIGKLQLGENPLGMFLTVPDEASNRPLALELQRDESTKRRWEVLYTPRSRNNDASAQSVGEFLLEGEELFFQWTEREEIDPEINALRNCLLELKTPDASKTVILRAPATVPAIVLDAKKPQFRERLEIRDLPRAESISVQIVELPRDEFEEQFTPQNYDLNVDQPEMAIFFNTVEERRFFRLWHSADIGNSIRLESALQINAPDTPLYNRASLRRLNDMLYAEQARISQLNIDAQAWQAPDGQKRDHNRRKKEISARLDIVNAQVEAYELAKPVAERLLNRELHYRIFFSINGIEFDLAVSGAASDESD